MSEIVVRFSTEAMEVITAVERRIMEAKHWANSGQWMDEEPHMPQPELQRTYHEIRTKVADMEQSWHRSLVSLLSLAGSFGELLIVKDGEYSLFFHQPQSGFHGGLNYHPATDRGQVQRYGTFSVNS